MPSELAEKISQSIASKVAETIDAHLDTFVRPRPKVDVDGLKTEYNAVQAGVKLNLERLISLRAQIGEAIGKESIAEGPSSSALRRASNLMVEAKSFAGVPFEENPE